MFFARGDPDTVVMGMVLAVAQDQDHLLADINCIASKHGAQDRLGRVQSLQNKIKRYLCLLFNNVILESFLIYLALGGCRRLARAALSSANRIPQIHREFELMHTRTVVYRVFFSKNV